MCSIARDLLRPKEEDRGGGMGGRDIKAEA